MNEESIYRSSEKKQEILNLYQEKLDSLNMNYKSEYISTKYGETHVVIIGDRLKPALVLIHGSNGNSAIVIEPLLKLTETHCIYAIDVIGQPNKSSELRPSMKDLSYGIWLDEVLDSLKLINSVIYGMSFGGFILIKLLLQNSKRVSEAILHVPAGIVNGNPLVGIFKIFLPMKKYIKTGDQKSFDMFLSTAFTEPDDFAKRFLSLVLRSLKMDFTQIPLLGKKDAKHISNKVHVIAADNDSFFPGKKLLKRLTNILPNKGKTLLLENCKHVPSTEHNKKIVHFINELITSTN